MSRQMRANSTMGAVLAGSWSAVGQNSAISSYVTRPSRNAPIAPSRWLKSVCSSSSTRCQLRSWPGPSKKPSRETDRPSTTFLIATSTEDSMEQEPLAPDVPVGRTPGRRAEHALDTALTVLVDQDHQRSAGSHVVAVEATAAGREVRVVEHLDGVRLEPLVHVHLDAHGRRLPVAVGRPLAATVASPAEVDDLAGGGAAARGVQHARRGDRVPGIHGDEAPPADGGGEGGIEGVPGAGERRHRLHDSSTVDPAPAVLRLGSPPLAEARGRVPGQ